MEFSLVAVKPFFGKLQTHQQIRETGELNKDIISFSFAIQTTDDLKLFKQMFL